MLKTPLDSLHRQLGAKMVPFAGYDMPVQYAEGIIKEHLHTRAAAGLFDVSHMGQVIVSGSGATAALEALVPVDLQALDVHRQSYALFTNETGGVRDDLIITRWGQDEFFLVVNAGCKHDDIQYLRDHCGDDAVAVLEQQALLALQGPQARAVMQRLLPSAGELPFLSGLRGEIAGIDVYVTCSGYTGEDGYELSCSALQAEALAVLILDQPEVAPIGLGARDSLRLEAGLCLYGHELAADITPVQASLMWSISPARRRDGERAGGFPGAELIFQEQVDGPSRKRVGLRVDGKRPVRDGQRVQDHEGRDIGVVTSGAYGATAGMPLALALIDPAYATIGGTLAVDVRGKAQPVIVTKTPFVAQRYYRG